MRGLLSALHEGFVSYLHVSFIWCFGIIERVVNLVAVLLARFSDQKYNCLLLRSFYWLVHNAKDVLIKSVATWVL